MGIFGEHGHDGAEMRRDAHRLSRSASAPHGFSARDVHAAGLECLPAIEALYRAAVAAMRGTPCDIWWDMEYHPSKEALVGALRAGNLFMLDDGLSAIGAFILDAEQGADYDAIPWQVPCAPGEVAVLHLLCVAPGARGRGVGKVLVAAAAAEARRRGARALRLDAFDNNEPAVELYRSCGFVDLGVFDIRVGGGLRHPSHLMELDLRLDEPAASRPDAGASAGPAADVPSRLLDPASLGSCALCPRCCGVNRLAGECGICGAAGTLRLARAALHFWEEPPISGAAGSGTVFFSGCSLKCVYCQNHEISTGNFGIEVTPERLVEIMLELQDQGALNINLVTATHFAHLLPEALAAARRRGLAIPIVYNTSGYERVEAVRELGDLVDIWLTDFKYADAALGQRLSHVANYPAVARAALAEMVACVERRGGIAARADGTWTRGIIVRHLVLPGHADDSCRVLDAIWETAGDIPISVMNQYTPNAAMRAAGGELSRAVRDDEYERVLDYADDLGFTQLFWQEGGAVDESFTPPFDTTGVLVRADARTV